MPFKYPSPVDRLLAHTVSDIESGCWIWTGSVNNVGRPRIAVRFNGKSRWVTVARFIVQFVHGKRWGRNDARRKVGAHRCHNPLCANPDHVQGGSQKKNIQACVASGRHKSGWIPHNLNRKKYRESSVVEPCP